MIHFNICDIYFFIIYFMAENLTLASMISKLSLTVAGTYGGGQNKPFKYSETQRALLGRDKLEDERDRKVPLQPLLLSAPGHPQHRRVQYNLRKLAELPYHLIECKRSTDLRKEVRPMDDYLFKVIFFVICALSA